LERVKIHRNIFISTAVLTAVAITVLAIYLDMVLALDFELFLKIYLGGIVAAAVMTAVSVIGHYGDLRPAVKATSLPDEKRFSSGEEWFKMDRRLASYPRAQYINTLFAWTVGASIVGVVFHYYLHYVSIRQMTFIAFGGVIMGGITGSYNYFFFKLHLAPLRRKLAPSIPPPDWKPYGSMRRMLSSAFIAICMVLTFFPAAVLFIQLDKFRWEGILNEGEGLIRMVDAQFRSSSPIQKGNLTPNDLKVLKKIQTGTKGYIIVFDKGEQPLYGSQFKISDKTWSEIKSKKSGVKSDPERGIEIIFGPVGHDELKAAVVYERENFSESDVRLLRFVSIAIGLALFMATGLIVLIRRYFGGSIENLVSDVELVAKGDFQRHIKVCSDGEMGTLEAGLASMKHRLVDLIDTQMALVERIGSGVGQVLRAASAMREIAGEQSATAAEQAGAAQEAGVTSQEVKSSSAIISERIDAVSEMAADTLDATKRGNISAGETVDGIKKVDQRVKVIAEKMLTLGENIQSVGKIADTIEEISEKTHLLAINAGIEAVGAGEAGERFGVVAAEIRNLAQSTAKSAEEVRRQVDEIRKATAESVIFTEEGTKAVSEGLQKVESVAKAFTLMENIAEKTSQNSQEIAMSIRQQTTAIEQVAQTMDELNNTAAQANEGAKKIEAATEELDRLAEELKEMVSSRENAEETDIAPE